MSAPTSRHEDELWELVPVDRGPAPAHLVEFVRGLERSERALDLGTGDGRLAPELDAGELTIADVSQVALGRARTRLPDARAVALEPDAPLPFDDSEFDLVVCVNVIAHVRDVQLLLSEARRVLRPSGRLALVAGGHGRWTGLDVLVRGFERRFDPLSPHVRFFTRRSLRRVLEAMGFDVVALRRRRGDLMAVAQR